eukprot:11294571-Prorocentrum_lima.AAC.1
MGDGVNARGLLLTSCDKGCTGRRNVFAPLVAPDAYDVSHFAVCECPHVVVASFCSTAPSRPLPPSGY